MTYPPVPTAYAIVKDYLKAVFETFEDAGEYPTEDDLWLIAEDIIDAIYECYDLTEVEPSEFRGPHWL